MKVGPIICVVDARPNFMKMAPILRALAEILPAVRVLLVHTGQHYDREMSDRLFDDLSLPHPDFNLEVGSASRAVQTAAVMRRFEPILILSGGGKCGRNSELWDGQAVKRIADDLKKWIKER